MSPRHDRTQVLTRIAPMFKRDSSPLIALCASLSLHAALVWAIYHSVEASPPLAFSPPAANQSEIYVPEVQRPDDRMGLEDGTGYAINAAPGERPMHARQADEDQAFNSKDPQGPGAPADAPSWNTSLLDQPLPRPLPPPLAERPAPLQPFGLPVSPLPVPPAVRPIGPGAPAPQPPVAPPIASAAPPAATPGAAHAADPAVNADSEVDPFSKIGSIEFRDGRVDARFGRRVKATRPRLSLAGQVDVLRLQSPTVILKVNVDAHGDVTNVDLLKTSGSNEIDLACQHAIYNWWIEPPRNADGVPVPDTIVWHISWQS